MPEHEIFRQGVVWLKDLALACTLAKPALLTITEFILYLIGLMTVLMLALRAY